MHYFHSAEECNANLSIKRAESLTPVDGRLRQALLLWKLALGERLAIGQDTLQQPNDVGKRLTIRIQSRPERYLSCLLLRIVCWRHHANKPSLRDKNFVASLLSVFFCPAELHFYSRFWYTLADYRHVPSHPSILGFAQRHRYSPRSTSRCLLLTFSVLFKVRSGKIILGCGEETSVSHTKMTAFENLSLL